MILCGCFSQWSTLRRSIPFCYFWKFLYAFHRFISGRKRRLNKWRQQDFICVVCMYDFGSGVKLCGVNYCRDFFLANRWKNRKKRKNLIPQKFSAPRFAKSFTMVKIFDAQNFSRTFSKGDTIMLYYSLIKRKYISLLHWGMSEFSSDKNLLWWKGASLCLSPINLKVLTDSFWPVQGTRSQLQL